MGTRSPYTCGEAKRSFEEQRRQVAMAFRVDPGLPAVKLDSFDPEADEIVIVPRVRGG